MGASESKPSTHIFKASGPGSVSQELIDSLQSSHETDASRSRLVEAKIQARVAEELKALQKKEEEALSLAHKKIAAAPVPDKKSDMSSRAVSQQLGDLRRLLDERKQARPLPQEVESARSDLVKCLIDNDRRPLDCYEEVDKFKAEVKKLEQQWVNKVTS